MQRQGQGGGEAEERGVMGDGPPPAYAQYPPGTEFSPLAMLMLARFGMLGQAVGQGPMPWAGQAPFAAEKSNSSAKVNNGEGDAGSMGRPGVGGHSSANDGTSDRGDGRGLQRSEDNSMRSAPEREAMAGEQYRAVTDRVQALGGDQPGLWKLVDSACERGDMVGAAAAPATESKGQGVASSPPNQKAFQDGGFWRALQLQQQQSGNGSPRPEGRFLEPQPCGFAAWEGRDRSLDHKANGAWSGACQQRVQSEAGGASLSQRHASARADLPGESSARMMPSQQVMRSAMGEQSWRRVRSVMLKQQEQFMGQLWELHRLHWLQGFLETAQCLGDRLGCDSLREDDRMAAGGGPEAPRPTGLQQPQPQCSQNLTQFFQQMIGEVAGWAQMKADASAARQDQCRAGRPCAPPAAFPQPSCPPQFAPPGYAAPLSGSSCAGSSPECPVPVMPGLVNDPHALWYAKHYGHMAKALLRQQASGGEEQETCGAQQVEGAPAAENGVDVPTPVAPPPLDPMTGTAVAAAVQAVTEANPQRWWHDAARVLGKALATNQAASPSGNDRQQEQGKEPAAAAKGRPWHSKDKKGSSKRAHAKEKACSSRGMVEASAENSTGSNRQAPLMQEAPLGTNKSGLASLKKASKRKNGKRASHSSRLHKKSRRSRPCQAESIGSDVSGTLNDVEDDDAVHNTGGEGGGQGHNYSSFPRSMASILLSLSSAPVE